MSKARQIMLSIRSARDWASLLGSVLAIAAVFFVGLKLFQTWGQIRSDISIGLIECFAFLVLIIAHCVSNLLLARGWYRILLSLNQTCSWTDARRIYAQSQIAKYLPGNILQFVGRQALGRAIGISHRTLLISTALEVALLATSAALFMTLLSHRPVLLTGPWNSLFLYIGLFASACVAAHHFCRPYVEVLALYAAYFWASGIAFVALLLFLSTDIAAMQYTVVAGSYVVAWVVGLLTPGAPAGLGVREAVLISLFEGSQNTSEPTILLAAVLGRAISTLGDLLFYAAFAR